MVEGRPEDCVFCDSRNSAVASRKAMVSGNLNDAWPVNHIQQATTRPATYGAYSPTAAKKFLRCWARPDRMAPPCADARMSFKYEWLCGAKALAMTSAQTASQAGQRRPTCG